MTKEQNFKAQYTYTGEIWHPRYPTVIWKDNITPSTLGRAHAPTSGWVCSNVFSLAAKVKILALKRL